MTDLQFTLRMLIGAGVKYTLSSTDFKIYIRIDVNDQDAEHFLGMEKLAAVFMFDMEEKLITAGATF